MARPNRIAIIAGILFVAACGQPEPAPTTSSTTAPPATTDDSTSTTTKPTTTGKPPDPGKDDGFAWLPFGPASPGSPPPLRWYGGIERGHCSEEDPDAGTVWFALNAVCHAAVDGAADKWAVAAAVHLGQPKSCLEKAANDAVTRALAWHQRHPTGKPVVRFATRGQPTACDYRITDVTVTTDTDCQAAANKSAPLQGTVKGGTLLRIGVSASAIDGDANIFVGTKKAEILCTSELANVFVVSTPAVDKPQQAAIRISNDAADITSAVKFAYVP